MEKSITPNQIKQNNRGLIYHYIYKNQKVSQQDISYDLRLSRPTVTANLNAMEQEGLIRKNGQIDTEYVGRKAAAYSISADYRISIGVEILKSLTGPSVRSHMNMKSLILKRYVKKYWILKILSAQRTSSSLGSDLPCRH